MGCYTITNEQIVIAANMAIATCISVVIGILFRLLGLPCWLICGSIAVIAVVTEHYLTLHPLPILKYLEQLKAKRAKKKTK